MWAVIRNNCVPDLASHNRTVLSSAAVAMCVPWGWSRIGKIVTYQREQFNPQLSIPYARSVVLRTGDNASAVWAEGDAPDPVGMAPELLDGRAGARVQIRAVLSFEPVKMRTSPSGPNAASLTWVWPASWMSWVPDFASHSRADLSSDAVIYQFSPG